jgi:hypothetical protein
MNVQYKNMENLTLNKTNKNMVDGLLQVTPLVDIKVIIETLSRMGIANTNLKILYPSCYLHEIEGKHYLCHFKQMFMITRSNSYDTLCDGDIERRNSIAFCLKKWNMIDCDDNEIINHNTFVNTISHQEKQNGWQIMHKFNTKNL